MLDARSADRYRGENETLDPVAGHIPGAVNRFFKLNLGDRRPLQTSRSQLNQEFSAMLNGYARKPSSHQCGSGVTACHNLLAMEVAGLAGSRLYPGSWSDGSATANGPSPKAASDRSNGAARVKPLLADLILVVHFAFVLFVVGRLPLIWTRRRSRLALGAQPLVPHCASGSRSCSSPAKRLPACGARSPCGKMRCAARRPEKSFIARWVHRMLFYSFPEWVFTVAYLAFALIVADHVVAGAVRDAAAK